MNKAKHFLQRFLGITCVASVLLSCDHSYLNKLDDIEDYNYSPTIALPLINSQLDLSDLVDSNNEGIVQSDEDRLLWIVHKGRSISIQAKDLFKIADQQESFTLSISPGKNIKSQQISQRFYLDFPSGTQVDSMLFRSGTLVGLMESMAARQDGYTLSARITLPDSRSTNGSQKLHIDLQENTANQKDLTAYTLIFRRDQDGRHYVNMDITYLFGGQGNPTKAPYTVKFELNIRNTSYDILYGQLDTRAFPISSSRMDLSILGKSSSANIYFETPRIEVKTTNTYGAPLDIRFESFFATNDDDQRIDITTTAIPNPWRINHPTLPDQQAVTQLQLNKTNSNIVAVSEILPTQIQYQVTATINPDGPVPNFLKHDSRFLVDVEFHLPMHLRLDYFDLEDTLSLGISEDIIEKIQWLEMNIQVINNFPLEASLRIFLADENYNILDELLPLPDQQTLIPGAVVNPVSGLVTQASTKKTTIEVKDQLLENLKKTEHLLLRARMATSNSQEGVSVKIMEGYNLDLQINTRAKLSVQL